MDEPTTLTKESHSSEVQKLRELITPSLEEHEDLKAWCTDACLRRYLAARRFDVQKAEKMIKASFQWRLTYKPHHITWEEIKEQAITGKTFVSNVKDRQGRTIVMMRPRNENTKDSEQQIRFLVYNLEQATTRADKTGEEKMTWLIDFEGYSMKNAPAPRVGIQSLNILQSHYPERLALAVCYHPPWLFQVMYKATSPFIDPVTHKKIFFCEGPKGDAIMARFFKMDQMDECLGGTGPPQFKLEDYVRQQEELHGPKGLSNGHA